MQARVTAMHQWKTAVTLASNVRNGKGSATVVPGIQGSPSRTENAHLQRIDAR